MLTRRTFLRKLANGVFVVTTYPVLTANPLAAAAQTPTPPNIEGPYYEPGAPRKSDLREAGDNGTPLKVIGSLVDTSDQPIRGGLIEIWHADASGRYDLDGFRYRATLQTSQKGVYGFETYMPGNYGSRPKHIHYKITADGFQSLITQLYFENDPFFEGKPEKTLRKDPVVRYRELIRPVVPFRDRQAVSVNFKICLARRTL